MRPHGSRGFIKAFNAMPRVILGPIFIVWFGLGIWSKVTLGVTLVFFVVFFWLWRILHGNPDGPRILWIRRANRLLSSYTDPKPQMSSHQLFL